MHPANASNLIAMNIIMTGRPFDMSWLGGGLSGVGGFCLALGIILLIIVVVSACSANYKGKKK